MSNINRTKLKGYGFEVGSCIGCCNHCKKVVSNLAHTATNCEECATALYESDQRYKFRNISADHVMAELLCIADHISSEGLPIYKQIGDLFNALPDCDRLAIADNMKRYIQAQA